MLDEKMLEDMQIIDKAILLLYSVGSDYAYSESRKIQLRLISLSVKIERKLWPLRKIK